MKKFIITSLTVILLVFMYVNTYASATINNGSKHADLDPSKTKVVLSGVTLNLLQEDGKIIEQKNFLSLNSNLLLSVLLGVIIFLVLSLKYKYAEILAGLTGFISFVILCYTNNPIDFVGYVVCIFPLLIVPIIAPYFLMFIRTVLYIDKTPSFY